MQSFVLRRALPSDAPVIASLAITVWISTYATDSLPPAYAAYVLEQFTVERVREQIETAGTVYWVAEARGGLLGFAELHMNERTDCLTEASQAEVVRLYVLDRFSRQGIGRALLERSVETAFEQGASVVWLAMYSGNERARGFYRSLGWKQVGEMSFMLDGVAYLNEVLALQGLPHKRLTDW